jgi:hypothetical protein
VKPLVASSEYDGRRNFTPDPPLTAEELATVEQLNEEESKPIDNALLSNASYRWRKVAMVVAMSNLFW